MATILVVDDRAVNRDLVKSVLSRSSHRLLEAENGAEGLRLAKVEHPDLIVADILMPKMDGYEFVRELRSDPLTRDCAVVFWTANYAEDEVRVLADRSGVKHILSKPATPEMILEVVERALLEAPPDLFRVPDEEFRREHLALLNEKLLEQVRRLEEEEQRFRTVIEAALDAIISMDHEGKIVEFNPAAERIFGYERSSVIGRPLADAIIPPQLRDKHRRGLARYLATGEGPVLGNRLELTGIRSDGTELPVELSIFRVALPGPPVFTGFIRDITERREQEQNLRRADEERKKLLAHLVRAQEDERRRIASDVHDDSIQVMAAVGVRLGMLRDRVSDSAQVETISKLEDAVNVSIGRLRHLLFQLAPPSLEREGLAAAILTYLHEAFGEAGVEYDLEDLISTELTREIRTLVYRIAQEALSNVRKHAKARQVAVRLKDDEGGLLIRIRDDGVGYSPADSELPQPGHLGLVSMRERAEMLGGWFHLEGKPGLGTVVEFWVPVAERTPAPRSE